MAEEALGEPIRQRFDTQRKTAWAHYELERQLCIDQLEHAKSYYIDFRRKGGSGEDNCKVTLIGWYMTVHGFLKQIPDETLAGLEKYVDDPTKMTMEDASRFLRAGFDWLLRMGVTNILKTDLPDELFLINPAVKR